MGDGLKQTTFGQRRKPGCHRDHQMVRHPISTSPVPRPDATRDGGPFAGRSPGRVIVPAPQQRHELVFNHSGDGLSIDGAGEEGPPQSADSGCSDTVPGTLHVQSRQRSESPFSQEVKATPGSAKMAAWGFRSDEQLRLPGVILRRKGIARLPFNDRWQWRCIPMRAIPQPVIMDAGQYNTCTTGMNCTSSDRQQCWRFPGLFQRVTVCIDCNGCRHRHPVQP